MAKSKETTALASLTPNALRIQIDGDEIIVAANKKENDQLNMVMAAQIRNLIQRTLKAYKEKEIMPTPKELKEIAEAARNAAEFSGEIYKGADEVEAPSTKQEKPVEGEVQTLDDINFDAIKTGTTPPK